MQSIVADTTPLNLVLMQAADILPSLYRKVFIPPAVRAELAHANTPAIVRAWISQPPQWLEAVSLKQPIDSALAHLDAGEREAISLASELQAILLLMDERDGVTIARQRGLKVVGTLAALDLAAAHGPPSEPKQLALPEAGRRVHKDQGAGQWTHSAQKLPDFIDKKDERYAAALGALPNEMDGIIIKQLVSASMIKQHAHDVLDLRARRARQGKAGLYFFPFRCGFDVCFHR
jgi:predicted nucleic acid-binding protein